MLFLTRFNLLFEGWKSYVIASVSLVWVANIYMGLYSLIWFDIKKDKIGITMHYKGYSEDVPLPIASKTGLFRIVQEALTNVTRYAQPENVLVNLEKRDDRLLLTIQDGGIGVDLEIFFLKKTVGIAGMCERAAMMVGDYGINSSPGKGTTIIVQVLFISKFNNQDSFL